MKKLTFENPAVAIELTKEQAQSLGIDLTEKVQHGELETVGSWSIPVSFKALACSAKYTRVMYTKCVEKTFYGTRTASNLKQGGYELEGRVSIEGKKYTCFTSSQLFEIEGELYNVAVIHARI